MDEDGLVDLVERHLHDLPHGLNGDGLLLGALDAKNAVADAVPLDELGVFHVRLILLNQGAVEQVS